MNGNRNNLWNQQIWSEIDKSVQDEVGRVRLGQKVFPSIMFPNTQPIPAGAVSVSSSGSWSIPEGATKPFVEISVEFRLTQSQVDSEEQIHTGRNLARMAASRLAIAEDTLLFKGEKAMESLRDTGVLLMNAHSMENGIPGAAHYNVSHPGGQTAGNPVKIYETVVEGISKLNQASEPGPYALFLSSEVYAETYAPLQDSLVTAADRIIPLVQGGGFYGAGSLAVRTGLLVSLGGQPTVIYVGTDATTVFTQTDLGGNYCFRVFERVQYVVRDPWAIVNLKF